MKQSAKKVASKKKANLSKTVQKSKKPSSLQNQTTFFEQDSDIDSDSTNDDEKDQQVASMIRGLQSMGEDDDIDYEFDDDDDDMDSDDNGESEIQAFKMRRNRVDEEENSSDIDEFGSSSDVDEFDDDDDDDEEVQHHSPVLTKSKKTKLSKQKQRRQVDEDDEDQDDFDVATDDDIDDDDDAEFGMNYGVTQKEITQLQSHVSSLSKQDDAAIFKHKKDVSTDRSKAIHVANQQRLWQTALQHRLRLQHPLTLVQRLPSSKLLPYFASPDGASPIETSKACHQKMSIAAAVTAQALGDMIEVERSLSAIADTVSTSESHLIEFVAPEICSGLTALARKKYQKRALNDEFVGPNKRFKTAIDRDLDVLESYLSKTWEKSRASRSKVMDKWGKRIQIASGKAELNISGLNQPLSTQVSQLVNLEGDRYITRSRLRRAAQNSLGDVETNAGRQMHESVEEYDERIRNSRFDAEIFDDNDFYSVVLREMTTTTDTIGAGLSNVVEAQADLMRRTRMLVKGVGTRAAKNRKIRFAPIPTLVGFMAPIVTPQWLAACATVEDAAVQDSQELFVDELLDGLFGQKSRAQPIIPTHVEEEEEDEEEEESEFGDVNEELYGDFEEVESNTNTKDDHLDPNIKKKNKLFTDLDKSSHMEWFNGTKA